MEEMIFNLADSRLFFNDLEVRVLSFIQNFGYLSLVHSPGMAERLPVKEMDLMVCVSRAEGLWLLLNFYPAFVIGASPPQELFFTEPGLFSGTRNFYRVPTTGTRSDYCSSEVVSGFLVPILIYVLFF